MPQSEPSGCLPAIFRIFGIGGGGSSSPPPKPVAAVAYCCVSELLSPAERSFLGILKQVVGSSHLVVMKVRVADVLEIPSGTPSWQSLFNKINAKHFDFVLCDPASTKPVLAIELDDKSHSRAKRQERDEFLAEACKAAGLPLLRVPCKAGYVANDLANLIRNAMASSK